jgi:hypothetical protein
MQFQAMITLNNFLLHKSLHRGLENYKIFEGPAQKDLNDIMIAILF